ncbi:MAG: type I pullulanase [Saprospiraceae bacterium]|nr:type I pullulanase [Saprospiraceae bacterium]
MKYDLTSFEDYPVYDGDDLGVTYAPENTRFRLWSPAADAVQVLLYAQGAGGQPLARHPMQRSVGGTWLLELEGDLAGQFYTYQVRVGDRVLNETPGPYARAVGVNGHRGCILDMRTTDPPGWDRDGRPALQGFHDIVVYELHVRDMSIHPSSGITHRGKYLGLAETGTRSPEGLKTGLDHLVELGITHVHILPVFDFASIDETRLEENKYNWGYEPKNYNVPEGSFATDPYDPATRIRELKTMIQALHQAGIRVIMDVVYNHTEFGEAGNFSLSLSAPGYYYRQNPDGSLSNASACGNETASERPMMRKYILESVEYWVREYHFDGFRFDLMGIHDIVTMQAVAERLHQIDPTLFIYGEGWKAGASPLPDSLLALKANMPKLRGIAAFSDELRDGVKGSWHDWEEAGFVSGNAARKEGVKFGIVGGVHHPEIDYQAVPESDAPWAASADQCMVYVSCHDNHTLYDKLKIVNPDASENDILSMHVLAQTIVLTSQGIPFLHAGVDFLRTKQGVENSFDAPDSINQIDWSRKHTYQHVNQFYRDMIRLRRSHPIFKLNSQSEIARRLQFLEGPQAHILAYTVDGTGTGDDWQRMLCIFNGGDRVTSVELPAGDWRLAVSGTRVIASNGAVYRGKVDLPAHGAMVLYQKG